MLNYTCNPQNQNSKKSMKFIGYKIFVLHVQYQLPITYIIRLYNTDWSSRNTTDRFFVNTLYGIVIGKFKEVVSVVSYLVPLCSICP